ncbi:AraC family transcriptional regulator [Paenibacillus polymyxa]|uniref:AraC family transcriptional regulator n=1 Tax=Paenibacillus polymyxa TaxID=1406 RepID=UPI002AB4D932|nr:AraC family transcriptional regulator [Paenibacillus polymyxa]MDY7990315.1 AraC family transcriptional regulator [Paenibacillus polymyxa]MDY8117145.1 AraC family transcriptional regulator [Paenibacillus polymyxa]
MISSPPPSDISTNLQELIHLIHQHASSDGTFVSSVPGLYFRRASHVSELNHTVHMPSLYVVAQGSKTAMLAGENYVYDPTTYMVTSVQLPVIGKITQASSELPYLSLQLSISPDVILDIIKKSPPQCTVKTGRGILVSQFDPLLLDALLRLVRLSDTPADIQFLAPLITHEILYRVLQGEQGALIRQFAVVGSYAHSISQAIHLITRDYSKPLVIEELAKEVNMSPSSLHKHFKKVTAISPLQYQKAIRLQTARRLLLSEGLEAANAGFRVGYESPSQFSREYGRMFGRPPMSDVKHLRNSLSVSVD